MLVLAVFIYFKLTGILEFVNDFVIYGTYNSYLEPFSGKTGLLFYLSLLLIIIGSVLLIILLKRKNKPWKIYLVYIVLYTLILGGVIFTNSYFNKYTIQTPVSGVIIYRDMLNICRYLQFGTFILLGIRILGIDVKSFDFSKDEEFLELSQDDREEFEVSFEFDQNSINRKINLIKRHIIYFYKEHRFISNVVITTVLVSTILYTYYYFGILHKSYGQNQTFRSGMYSITIKDSFVTDKDFGGNKIEDGNKFVVIFINIKNNSNSAVEPNLNRYHLMNGNSDKTYTTYYNSYFSDLGVGADSKISIPAGGSREFYMVFKEKEELKNNRFVLYYQELGGKLRSYLRKIKLKMNDLSQIKNSGTYKIDDEIVIKYRQGEDKSIIFTNYAIDTTFSYSRYYCSRADYCGVNSENIRVKDGYKILKIEFASSDFEGEEFIDFSEEYGRIKYIDNNGKTKYSNIVDAIDMDYQGKVIYIRAKNEILDSNKLSIVYTVRNNKYTLKLK